MSVQVGCMDEILWYDFHRLLSSFLVRRGLHSVCLNPFSSVEANERGSSESCATLKTPNYISFQKHFGQNYTSHLRVYI